MEQTELLSIIIESVNSDMVLHPDSKVTVLLGIG
jgi:hypothetical protein